MEVILTEDVEKVGKAGDRIRVSEGFGRNFLIPNRLAVLSSTGGLKFLEAKKRQAQEKREKEKLVALNLKTKIEQVQCVIKVKVGPEGKLYGSVTRHDIQRVLNEQGLDLDRKRIELGEPIREVGEYTVQIDLHSELKAPLKVVVTEE